MNIADALADLAARGITAVPVQTMRELADRHRAAPTRTVRFEKRERDGWATECFASSWFAFDGEPAPRPAAPPRIGSDAPAILGDLGYTAADVDRLIASGIVGPTEWFHRDRNP
jgi:crotonobetainyl-CoA:carnitine CoA-transferase CaiB-like acyl-CoA transferase